MTGGTNGHTASLGNPLVTAAAPAAPERLSILDTTLRDGEQSPGVALSADDKLAIARQLARLRVDVIEAGFPFSSPGDYAAVRAIAEQVEGPVIAGLSRCFEGDVRQCAAALEPAGCRILSFRGHDVTLICFHRDGNQLAHLFVVDRAALPKLKPGAGPIFSSEGEWTTATWAEKDRAYMIAVQGDRDAAQRYLPDA